jgi:hypothetical protein
MATKTVDAPALDLLADFRTSARRAPMYTAASDATRALVPAVSDAAYVTRGAHAKNGTAVLLVQDGSTQTALPLAAVGAAIAAGVITRAELDALTA